MPIYSIKIIRLALDGLFVIPKYIIFNVNPKKALMLMYAGATHLASQHFTQS